MTRNSRTLGALVSPLMDHSLNPGGASIAVTFAFCMNGSLMIFTVNPLPFLAFAAVSLILGALLQQKDTIGGQLVTWMSGVSRCIHDHTACENRTELNQLHETAVKSNLLCMDQGDDYCVPEGCEVLNTVRRDGRDKGDWPGYDTTDQQLVQVAEKCSSSIHTINGACPTVDRTLPC